MELLRKQAVPIPCRWMTAEQTTLNEIGIETNTSDGEDKLVYFYFISNLYEYEDKTDGKTRTAIQSDGKEYITDLPAADVMTLFEN